MKSEWRFHYLGSFLGDKAALQAKHHRRRETVWRGELVAAETALKATGVEFREVAITGGKRIDAVLDPQKQARVQECRGKVESHRQAAEEYELYAHLFQQNAGREFDLDIEDAKFFALGSVEEASP